MRLASNQAQHADKTPKTWTLDKPKTTFHRWEGARQTRLILDHKLKDQ